MVTFVWGPGGVGKSHVAIRQAALSKEPATLLTLDPSLRLYDLLHQPHGSERREIQLDEFKFGLMASNADRLFELLQAKAPANERVRWYFGQLVNGLQRFRDYLALLQLAEWSRDEEVHAVVDTPPFQEAKGLHYSILSLKEFFHQSLVQISLRSSVLNIGIRKVIELFKHFIGSRAVNQALEFLDWLSQHVDRFQKSSIRLEEIVFSPDTRHVLVLTPESSLRYLKEMKTFFDLTSKPHLVLNRSAMHFQIPKTEHPFFNEFRFIQSSEGRLTNAFQDMFPSSPVKRIPMLVMGEDTLDELTKFIRA